MRAAIENPTPKQLAAREYMRVWRDANRERYREMMRKHRAKPGVREAHNKRTQRWAHANPDKARASKLRRNFGITLERLTQQIELQGGRCPICARVLQGGRKQHVDHDHATGLVRGVLCATCNRLLGVMHDSVEALERAAQYLRSAGVWRAE